MEKDPAGKEVPLTIGSGPNKGTVIGRAFVRPDGTFDAVMNLDAAAEYGFSEQRIAGTLSLPRSMADFIRMDLKEVKDKE